ncbi:MAG: hypothetical protein PHC70_02570 [Patescibacteria group bacterium]|nr:hypothetical protein [Patescibacteria group bacterium]
MDPTKDFSHFIAYYLPGALSALVFLLFSSCLVGRNLLADFGSNIGAYAIIFLIGGSVLGLILDEAHHLWLDPYYEKSWAKSNNCDIGSIQNEPDFMVSAKDFGLPLYQQLLEEQYYYYEFDVNIAVALTLLSIAAPIYLYTFSLVLNWAALSLTFLIPLILGIISWKFGAKTYQDFYTISVDLISTVDPDYLKRIKKL